MESAEISGVSIQQMARYFAEVVSLCSGRAWKMSNEMRKKLKAGLTMRILVDSSTLIALSKIGELYSAPA